jgi:hypothetical protein
MPILNLFSKRQKQQRGEVPDVYQYTDLPKEFRVQVVHILKDALGESRSGLSKMEEVFKVIHDVLCREYGVFHLSDEARNGYFQAAVFNFFLNCEDTERALDVIEISFRLVKNVASEYEYRVYAEVKIEPDEAIPELNERFLEHGIGYQFEAGEIIRIDSKYIHAEAIKPTLDVLSEEIYAGANDEFLKAHDHYRHKRYKECLNECLKSFESTMKAICEKRKWQYKSSDTAKTLLDICFHKGLIPDFFQAQFSSLRAGLESGIPTVRNKLSGHGQGTEPKAVPQYMARYLLNLTATSILLLTDAEKELQE